MQHGFMDSANRSVYEFKHHYLCTQSSYVNSSSGISSLTSHFALGDQSQLSPAFACLVSSFSCLSLYSNPILGCCSRLGIQSTALAAAVNNRCTPGFHYLTVKERHIKHRTSSTKHFTPQKVLRSLSIEHSRSHKLCS